MVTLDEGCKPMNFCLLVVAINVNNFSLKYRNKNNVIFQCHYSSGRFINLKYQRVAKFHIKSHDYVYLKIQYVFLARVTDPDPD